MQKLKKLAKTSNKTSDWENYETLKNKLNNKLENLQKDDCRDYIMKHKTGRKIWNLVKKTAINQESVS